MNLPLLATRCISRRRAVAVASGAPPAWPAAALAQVVFGSGLGITWDGRQCFNDRHGTGPQSINPLLGVIGRT